MLNMNKSNPEVDPVFIKAKKWKEEMLELRSILHETKLSEELKWWQACYTYNNKNVAIISAFKEYCVLSFFKGVLLKDPKKLLVKPGANSQSARFMKFTSVDEIKKLRSVIKSYIKESLNNEDEGMKVAFKKITEHKIPDELQTYFNSSSKFEKAFKSLTPGRQRGYLLYFTSAKQSATRNSRIEKYKKQILSGKGIHDH